jgi:hypothetical protein
VATRLSQGLPWPSVLLIEAGPSAPDEERINIPGRKGSTLGTVYDWNFSTTAQAGAKNRVFSVPPGKVLGGSSTRLRRGSAHQARSGRLGSSTAAFGMGGCRLVYLHQSKNIHSIVLQYLATLGVLDERVLRDDSSIRNDRIGICHALCLDMFDSVKRRVFLRGVVLDNDEIASGAAKWKSRRRQTLNSS